jgi:hypothetical protein
MCSYEHRKEVRKGGRIVSVQWGKEPFGGEKRLGVWGKHVKPKRKTKTKSTILPSKKPAK